MLGKLRPQIPAALGVLLVVVSIRLTFVSYRSPEIYHGMRELAIMLMWTAGIALLIGLHKTPAGRVIALVFLSLMAVLSLVFRP